HRFAPAKPSSDPRQLRPQYVPAHNFPHREDPQQTGAASGPLPERSVAAQNLHRSASPALFQRVIPSEAPQPHPSIPDRSAPEKSPATPVRFQIMPSCLIVSQTSKAPNLKLVQRFLIA